MIISIIVNGRIELKRVWICKRLVEPAVGDITDTFIDLSNGILRTVSKEPIVEYGEKTKFADIAKSVSGEIC
jgi:hypothetical protein